MCEISKIDLAWEAVNSLFASLTLNRASAAAIETALEAIEQAGGTDPRSARIPPAAQELFVLLYGKYSQGCKIDVPTERSPDVRKGEIELESKPTAPRVTIRQLVTAFQPDLQAKRFKTRQNYEYLLKRVTEEHGNEDVARLDKETLQRWYAEWLALGDHMGYQMMNMIRMLFHVGSKTLGNVDCARLFGTIRDLGIKKGKVRTQEITAEQVAAILEQAHKMDWHSIALAQALQFELGLTLKQVIGEWVPLSEPGTSEVTRRNRKWLNGLLWSDIDANLILHMQDRDIDLRPMPMIMAELKRLGKRPTRGPMIVYERWKRPYSTGHFLSHWRIVADAAGVPKAVHNRDSARGKRRKREQLPSSTVFVQSDRGSELHEKVNAVVPRSLPDQVRSDVVHDIIVDLLAGNISEEHLRDKVQFYVTRHHKGYSNRFNTVSLDQPIPGTDDLRLVNVIPSDQQTVF